MAGEKILIVEDEPGMRELLKDILSEHGYNTAVADDGKKGLFLAGEEKPDLILLDVMMPGIDGYQTCEQLKGNEETKEIPIIMLTALDMGKDFEKGLEKGADWYITKPFDKEHLLKRITHLLEKKKNAEYNLSSRERQIMDAVFKLGQASAAEVIVHIPDPPTLDAVRRMIRILEEKKFLRHEVEGPRHIYFPTVEPEKARASAIDHVVKTHFKGSVSQAIAALLETSSDSIAKDELERIVRLIEESRKEGR